MLDITDIINYFEIIDKYLDENVDIFILGSSFFVFYRLKSASPDIDMILEGNDYNQILKTVNKINTNINVDIMSDCWIEDLRLPKNYRKKAKRYRRFRGKLKHISLWTLYIYDIIITKINRWENRDKHDIEVILNHYKIYKHKLEKRIKKCQITSEKKFEQNLQDFFNIFGDRLKEEWSFF